MFLFTSNNYQSFRKFHFFQTKKVMIKHIAICLLLSIVSAQIPTKLSELTIKDPGFTSLASNFFKNQQKNAVLLTTFGVTGLDSIYQISFQNNNLSKPQATAFDTKSIWPNQADYYQQYQLIVEAGGFFPNPSKATGDINLYQVNDDGQITSKIKVSKDKKDFFYHKAILVDLNGDGLPDILAARAQKSVLSSSGELIWLENKGNFQFEEHLLTNGPDVFFIFVDLDNDGKQEVVAAQYFSKELAIYTCQKSNWSLCNPTTIQKTLIDNTVGSLFNLELTDLNGDGKKELLVTNNSASGNGQVFIYEVPDNYNTGKFIKYPIGSTYKPSLALLPGRGAPGTASSFSLSGTKYKYIIVSGDDAGVVRLLIPQDGSFNYKEVIVCESKDNNTIGEVAHGDFNKDGFVDLMIPFYAEGKVEIWSFKKQQQEVSQ
ncbi:hypothetical protein ABPG72_010633 [Tetrahymena utriculariae]